MKILNWVFLALYLFILLGLFGFAYSTDIPSWLAFFQGLHGRLFWTVFVFIITIISQVLFIFSTGKIDLQRPKNKFLVLIPIAVAAIALAFLVYGLTLAVTEFFNGSLSFFDNNMGFWGVIFALWIAWGIVFFQWLKNAEKYTTFKNLIITLIAGSMLELLPAVLMHLVTSKRNNCFAGMYTGIAISFGLIVMLWSFGPGVIFLFIREKYKAELREKAGNKEQKPL